MGVRDPEGGPKGGHGQRSAYPRDSEDERFPTLLPLSGSSCGKGRLRDSAGVDSHEAKQWHALLVKGTRKAPPGLLQVGRMGQRQETVSTSI
jgi:hypothetical protein